MKPAYANQAGQQDGEEKWGKVGVALLLWGIVGLFISLYFNTIDQRKGYSIVPHAGPIKETEQRDPAVQPDYQIGPIVVEYPGEVYEIVTRTGLPRNHWSFIEIEVLDQHEDYLYSFGQELWHETGRDSDGSWTAARNDFETKVTFTQPGYYYLNFIVNSKRNQNPKTLSVKVVKRRGSYLPHFWMGIILMIAGLVLIEIQWGIFQKMLEAANDN